MDEGNEYNHTPSSSAAIASMFDAQGTARSGWDQLRPLSICRCSASSFLWADKLLLADVRWPRRARRQRTCQSVSSRVCCMHTGCHTQVKRQRASWAKSAEANAAGPADIGMNCYSSFDLSSIYTVKYHLTMHIHLYQLSFLISTIPGPRSRFPALSDLPVI